ncbi:hypothetical protein K449DRAFT_384427, partial [Hypoxylon sp. EC38]
MRVEPCLEYCGFANNTFDPGRKGYRYAGLEFARECWCGDTLSGQTIRMEDGACDVPVRETLPTYGVFHTLFRVCHDVACSGASRRALIL